MIIYIFIDLFFTYLSSGVFLMTLWVYVPSGREVHVPEWLLNAVILNGLIRLTGESTYSEGR